MFKVENNNSSPEEAILEVREKMISEVNADLEAYHPKDIQSLRDNDWLIRRFLVESNGNAEEALKALSVSLKWRKSCEINDIRGQDLPRELYSSGIMHLIRDKEGIPVFYVRMKLYKRTPGSGEFFKKSLNYFINRMDAEANEKQFAIIADLTEVGVSNFDLRIASYFFILMRTYFPLGAKYIWVFEPPRLMQPFMSFTLRLLPQKYRNLVKIVNRSSARDLMGEKCLPTFMGGAYEIKEQVSDNCPLLEDIHEKYNLTPGDAQLLKQHLETVKNSQ